MGEKKDTCRIGRLLVYYCNFKIFICNTKTGQIFNWIIDDISGSVNFQCGIGSPTPSPPAAPVSLLANDGTFTNRSIFSLPK